MESMDRPLAGVHGLLALLPRGTTLPAESWRVRHRTISLLLWFQVAALPVIALARDAHSLVLAAITLVALLAAAAGVARLGRPLRSMLATLGLVSSAALGVALFGGSTELHFQYFVVVAVVALYQSWWPYLTAVGFVLVEHGLGGSLAPELVFGMPMSPGEAWAMAGVHGGFLLAESAACVMFWKSTEDAVGRERAALADAESAHRDFLHAQELARIGSWSIDLDTEALAWSPQMYVLAGRDERDFTPTRDSWVQLVHPDDRERVVAAFRAAADSDGRLDLECRWLLDDGRERVVHALSEQPVGVLGGAAGGRRRIGTVRDVTEARRLQGEIEHLAYHDDLTGLANRRLFLERLEAALARRRSAAVTCAVLYLDLDGFKLVNDTYGHTMGDQLLRTMAHRLRSSVRADDVVARWGGDEFAVLLEPVGQAQARLIADHLGALLREPVRIDGIDVTVGASIGIAVATPGARPDDLLRDADGQMYVEKLHRGRTSRREPGERSVAG